MVNSTFLQSLNFANSDTFVNKLTFSLNFGRKEGPNTNSTLKFHLLKKNYV